jgi:hypothetical protein
LVVCGIDFKSLPDAPHFELKDWRKYVKWNSRRITYHKNSLRLILL